MTPDFKPGKAYLIKGKGIEQVKSKIKEWFTKHDFEVLEEGKKEIQGHKEDTWIKVDVWIYIKLKLMENGTLLIFHNENIKWYKVMIIIYPDLRRYADEWQKNLVRFLSKRKELGLDYYTKYCYIMYISGFIIFVPLIFNIFVQLPDIFKTDPIHLILVFVLLLLRYLTSMYKLRQANLLEYKVEEYKGETKID